MTSSFRNAILACYSSSTLLSIPVGNTGWVQSSKPGCLTKFCLKDVRKIVMVWHLLLGVGWGDKLLKIITASLLVGSATTPGGDKVVMGRGSH